MVDLARHHDPREDDSGGARSPGRVLSVHPTAATAFGPGAAEYERLRPSYPGEAVAYLVRRLDLRPGRTVLDLAAGTGKLTRLLARSGAELLAVEPLDEMRFELVRAVAGIRAFAGTAEAIPLPDESVDAVTVAQAFHWFRPAEAVREIRRVLRPDGALAVLWNEWDREDPRSAAVDAVVAPLRAAAPVRSDRWHVALVGPALFDHVEHRRFLYEESLSLEDAVAREGTTSVVAALEPAERAAVLERIRETLLPFGEPVAFRCWTDVYLAETA